MFKLKNQTNIGESEVEQALSRLANIPIDTINMQRIMAKERLSKRIEQSLFGQSEAVKQISSIVEISLAGLKKKNKPLGSFLFVGPTGVGKTELAKVLAKEMNCPLHQINMNEYGDDNAGAKLLGSPAGYINSDKDGVLKTTVGKTPKCVLLLDEIEKASKKILPIFLGIMEEGTVKDALGEDILFNQAIIIMTSNVGAGELFERSMGINQEMRAIEISDDAIKNHFAPEFLNRLSATIKFNKLGPELILSIVRKMVKEITQETSIDPSIKITLSDKAENWLALNGYNQTYGARFLGRKIETEIQKPLAESILYGEIKSGKKNVYIDVVENKLSFKYE